MSVTIHISSFQLNDKNILNKITSCLRESNLINSQDHMLYLFDKNSKSCFHLSDEEFQHQFKFNFYLQSQQINKCLQLKKDQHDEQKFKVECINKENIELH